LLKNKCKDYVWAKDDKARQEDQKRQYALTVLARETAEERGKSSKPKKAVIGFCITIKR